MPSDARSCHTIESLALLMSAAAADAALGASPRAATRLRYEKNAASASSEATTAPVAAPLTACALMGPDTTIAARFAVESFVGAVSTVMAVSEGLPS